MEHPTPNSSPSTRRRKKPGRNRWPDEVRDEVLARVLARLLALNQKRAEEERLTGPAAEAAEKKKSKGKHRGRKKASDEMPLLD